MTGPVSSVEGGLACPTWVGASTGPSLGHHPRVSLSEPPWLILSGELQTTSSLLTRFPLWPGALSCPRPVWWAGQRGVCGRGRGLPRSHSEASALWPPHQDDYTSQVL